MLFSKQTGGRVFTFKHFARRGYAAMQSMHRVVRIGCLGVATVLALQAKALSVDPDTVAQGESPTARGERLLGGAEVVGLEEGLTLGIGGPTETLSRRVIESRQAQSANDLLKLALGADVRQRGAMGIQTDVSLGGGTFDQVGIFVNGVSLSNPQTGHLAADFAVSTADIERIEVYDGGAALEFGSGAMMGAINIITRQDTARQVEAWLNGGSYGSLGGGAALNWGGRKVSHRVSAEYSRSDGGADNSDYSKIHAWLQGRAELTGLSVLWQGGVSGMRYGANTFYSGLYPNQWESNERLSAALKAETRGRVKLRGSLSWVRSYDHYKLIRGTRTGENFHRTDVLTASLGVHTNWALGTTSVGGELRSEEIYSTNLGTPLDSLRYVEIPRHNGMYYDLHDQRTNVSFFLNHALRVGRWSASAGVFLNHNTGLQDGFRAYPEVKLSYRIPVGGESTCWTIDGVWNKSLRLPTFTDLYYKSVTEEGNTNLRSEEVSLWKLATSLRHKGLSAQASLSFRRGHNMIDWVMLTADDIYHSTNFKLNNLIVQVEAAYDFERGAEGRRFVENVRIGYLYNVQDRRSQTEIYRSNYALNYLRHRLVASVEHRIWGPLSAAWQLRYQKRMGGYIGYDSSGESVLKRYHPYFLLDLTVNCRLRAWTLYCSAENLTNHEYYDIGSVLQPGFWFMAGLKTAINL